MQVNAITPDNTAPNPSIPHSIVFSLLASSAPLSKPDSAITGTDIKNENLADAIRLNPKLSKAVIVIPER